MKKFILFFILSLLLIAFGAFFINTYQLQKDYFMNKLSTQQKDNTDQQDIIEDVPSSFGAYSKEQYDTALEEKRILVLFFTSNWCKECLNQESIISKVFDELNKEGIVGLTVHILDSETTTETDALAKKFDITKESSFVILNKNGGVAYKYVGTLTAETLKQKIEEVISK